ncbi:hypothetical protein ScPMuIL_017247 [Solemya velum]
MSPPIKEMFTSECHVEEYSTMPYANTTGCHVSDYYLDITSCHVSDCHLDITRCHVGDCHLDITIVSDCHLGITSCHVNDCHLGITRCNVSDCHLGITRCYVSYCHLGITRCHVGDCHLDITRCHIPQTGGNLPCTVEISQGKIVQSSDTIEKKVLERGSWGGKLEFVLTCIGYAVGLGNVWRFPYLCYKNGGGAFLIPYWFMQLFVGMPLFFMELSFGQFASLGPIAIWKINPLFKGLGYGSVIVSALIGLYYNVIIGYCFFYFFSSMTGSLPWASCDHDWNSVNCAVDTVGKIVNGTNHTQSTEYFDLNNTLQSSNTSKVSPTEDFFYRYVLEMSDGMDNMGGVRWSLALCLLLAWVVVLLVLAKGIKSLGKVVYFTATFPYVLLTALLVRGVTLPGSMDGIHYYLTPKWERLLDSNVWSDAATQVFYSLSACSGGLILMSSFNQFKNFCLRDALIVPAIDCFTSFFSGFVIFSVLGFMAHAKGLEVKDVAAGGPGLAFIAYPEAIANMPAPTVWAILFFFMMLIIGFSSQFSIMETVISSLSDEYAYVLRRNWKRSTLFRISVCLFFYLLALPMTTRGGMYLLELLDTSVGGFPLLFVGLFECVSINYIYGYRRFSADIEMMLGKKPCAYWLYCWCFKTPLILLVAIIFKAVQFKPIKYHDYEYPDWAQTIYWLVCLFPILVIPFWFICRYCSLGGFRVLKEASRPLSTWGPMLQENRTGCYAKNNRITTQHESGLSSVYSSTKLDKKQLLQWSESLEETAMVIGFDNSAISPLQEQAITHF